MAIDAFLAYLPDRAGDSLRVVTWSAAEDFGGVYVRPDLGREQVLRWAEILSERLIASVGHDPAAAIQELGREVTMVHVREGVVILRFPLEEKRGIDGSLDVDVATDLSAFVSDCARRFDGETISFRSSAIA